MPTHPSLYDPSGWARLRQRALRSRGRLIPLVLISLEHCPYCKRVIREQLAPRIKKGTPAIEVLEFDLNDTRPINGLGQQQETSPSAWARAFDFRLAPTLTAVTPDLTPAGSPLLGYSSPDFYSAYLEDLILAGRSNWSPRE